MNLFCSSNAPHSLLSSTSSTPDIPNCAIFVTRSNTSVVKALPFRLLCTYRLCAMFAVIRSSRPAPAPLIFALMLTVPSFLPRHELYGEGVKRGCERVPRSVRPSAIPPYKNVAVVRCAAIPAPAAIRTVASVKTFVVIDGEYLIARIT